MLESMFDVDPWASEAALRAQVEEFERLKSVAAAAQARATALWEAKRRATEEAAGVPAAKRGRGLASEVALARHDAPVRGGTHLGMAQALVHEMPHTLAALESGALSEWRATLIVKESACLSVEHRGQLDAELCAEVSRLRGWGNKRVEAEAKKIAARLDVAAVLDRSAKAAQDRCVTIPARTRHHDLSERAVASAAGGGGICGIEPGREHHLRWAFPRADHGRHRGRTDHRGSS